MRKFTLLVLLIISLILAISCKKVNLLAPSYIPQETKFLSPPTNSIPKKIDVDPQPAKNGEVFGGFTKKFYYKGEWYVLANYIYYYDATNKTLTQNGNHALLKLDNDGNLMVIGRNLNSVRDGNGITTWTHLGKANIIEDNQIWYQNRNINKYGIGSEWIEPVKYVFGNRQVAIYSNNISYHSTDLLNWNTRGSRKNVAMGAPKNWASWQGALANEYFYNVYFKGKLYVLGGAKAAIGTIPSGKYPTRNFENIKVIDWGMDGFNLNNWKSYNYPQNTSYIEVYLYRNEKLYVKVLGNYYYYTSAPGQYSFGTSDYDHKPIYSTTGAFKEVSYSNSIKITTNKTVFPHKIETNTITNWFTNDKLYWTQEYSIPSGATQIYNYYNYNGDYLDAVTYWGPEIKFLPTTPTPPNWVQWGNNNIYYKSASSYDRISVGGKTYYLPIPPVNEIREAANRGYTNFTITDEHIKNSGKNQFMLTTVNPTKAKSDDWKLITPLEYTGYSMVWQIGADNYLFNLDGKIFQLMDYSQMNGFSQKEAEYSSIISELRSKAEQNREQAEKSTSYSQSYYYNAMYYDAQADILEKIFSKGGYIEPPEAITHYEIEFRNH